MDHLSRRTSLSCWRALAGRLTHALLGGAALAASAATAGCVEPTQGAIYMQHVAVPAAHMNGEGRPFQFLPPVELRHASESTTANTEGAVVRITAGVTCTGTLIADDLVLTAHHCVAERDASGKLLEDDVAPSKIGVELGGDYLPWGEVGVRAVVTPSCERAWGDGDVAILVLNRHLIGLPTATPRLEAPPKRAEPISIYGFGRCALTRDGIHRVRRESGPIDALAPGNFSSSASICPGDSGGPVYGANNEIIGVVSASVMDGDDKTEALSVFTRIDVWPQLFSAAHEISNGASPGELPPYRDCRPVHRAPLR